MHPKLNGFPLSVDQTLVNSLHGLVYSEIGGLDHHVITTEYRKHLFFNALVYIIYWGVSGQCYHTI